MHLSEELPPDLDLSRIDRLRAEQAESRVWGVSQVLSRVAELRHLAEPKPLPANNTLRFELHAVQRMFLPSDSADSARHVFEGSHLEVLRPNRTPRPHGSSQEGRDREGRRRFHRGGSLPSGASGGGNLSRWLVQRIAKQLPAFGRQDKQKLIDQFAVAVNRDSDFLPFLQVHALQRRKTPFS